MRTLRRLVDRSRPHRVTVFLAFADDPPMAGDTFNDDRFGRSTVLAVRHLDSPEPRVRREERVIALDLVTPRRGANGN